MSLTTRRTLTWLLALAMAVLAALVSYTPASAAATAPTKQLTVRFRAVHMTLSVPRSWHVSHTKPTASCGCGGEYRPVCLVAGGDYGLDPTNCVLMVGGDFQLQTPDYPLPGWRLAKCKHWTTTGDADSHLGSTPADYRAFLDKCTGARSEQWTSVTLPSVSLWHPMRGDASDQAAANAAASARIGGRRLSHGRSNDNGWVRGVRLHDGHAVVSIDRVVFSLDATVINRSPATYDYRVFTPRHDTDLASCRSYLADCTAKQLVAQFHKGLHPTDGTRPLDGRMVSVYRFLRGPYSLTPTAPYAFTSSGDTGKCDC